MPVETERAAEVIQHHVALNKEIESLHFLEYTPRYGAKERMKQRRSAGAAREAEDNCPQPWHGWSDIIEKVSNVEEIADVVRDLLKHESSTEKASRIIVPVHEVKEGWIDNEAETLSGTDSVLAICSSCITRDGKEKHIPMLDFRCPPSRCHQLFLKTAMQEMGQTSGALLESGRSYHFYGLRLLSQSEWSQFMKRSLLLTPFVDARYIAHRLLSGAAVLRITTSSLKPVEPCVVDWI